MIWTEQESGGVSRTRPPPAIMPGNTGDHSSAGSYQRQVHLSDVDDVDAFGCEKTGGCCGKLRPFDQCAALFIGGKGGKGDVVVLADGPVLRMSDGVRLTHNSRDGQFLGINAGTPVIENGCYM